MSKMLWPGEEDDDEVPEPQAKRPKSSSEDTGPPPIWERFFGGKWIPFNKPDSALLESHFREKKLVFRTTAMSFNKGKEYEFKLDPDNSSQINVETGTLVKIRRVVCWTCEQCTYLNHVQYPRCKICRSPREPNVPPVELPDSKTEPPPAKKPKLPKFFSNEAPLTSLPSSVKGAFGAAFGGGSGGSSYGGNLTARSLLELQEELVDNIFSYLDHTSRFICLGVCHQAEIVLRTRPKAWGGSSLKVTRRFPMKTWSWLVKMGFKEVEIPPEYASEEMLLALAKNTKLQTLRVANCKCVNDKVIAALSKCPLRNLVLNDCPITDASLKSLSECILETLDLINCTEITDDGLFHLKHHTRLHIIQIPWNKNISNIGLSYLKKCPLQLLNLSMCPCISDNGIQELSHCPLERLSVNGTCVGDAGLVHLRKQHKLRWLAVEGCGKITDDGLQNLKDLPLEVLHISHCQKLTDNGIRALDHIPLRHLRISRNPLLTDECLRHLNPTIQNLELNWCPKITDKGLQHVSERLPYLRALDVEGCKLLTKRGTDFLSELPLRTLKTKHCPHIPGYKH